jgi:glycerophosphoryl diester phosphodiesterase
MTLSHVRPGLGALLVAGMVLAGSGCGPADELRAPTRSGLVGNIWLSRRNLNFAHQGGAREAPSNTLYAFKRAVAVRADVLELDVHMTLDGHIVVLHDATVNKTTNGSGSVDQMTLAQVKALDAAYWFVPGTGAVTGKPESSYTLRGVATGLRPPPEGYSANDFTIPTLREVLEAFPSTFINIEIKETQPSTVAYERPLAELLGAFGRSSDTIVVSSHDEALIAFQRYASAFCPDVSIAAGTITTARENGFQAIQVPLNVYGIPYATTSYIAGAHRDGLAVHVWTLNSQSEWSSALSRGADGIMTDRPQALHAYLCSIGRVYDPASCP